MERLNFKTNEIDDKLHEECGIFGINSFSGEDVAKKVYYGLYALQHRGQESAGIASNYNNEIILRKNMGLVAEAISKEDIEDLKGSVAIGHVRYATCGESNIVNAQPLVGKTKLGNISIAHNGTLVNTEVIKSLLEDSGTLFQTTIDSEIILNFMVRSASKGIVGALRDALDAVKGAYALVLNIGETLIGVRDPYGIRPLILGKTDDNYVLASESCALDAVGAEIVRDIQPGEMVFIEKDNVKSIKFCEQTNNRLCSFEYIYFARPDSKMDGLSVYQTRLKMGEILYKESNVESDVVIGVPDSGIPAAIGYSRASNIPFELGFNKNKYIGRTFIAPSQELREKNVSIKLNALKDVVGGKRVILIDDSIVRGTTSKHLVENLRNAGAKEIHFRVSSPMVKHPCYFGIDTPYRDQLIAAVKSKDEIRDYIGADSLEFLSQKGLEEALSQGDQYCSGCFTGRYPISILQD